ncbi:hypothetical protein CDN99_16505 [Roseateles aquatilis]|uniref:Uncharacterized protein n=1 Tax=Roseateles aquatilis TaxID=431061 RepID=A0A246J7D7_9BURK|nr:hypothetical protein [Roseateles aquatilis]OWQ88458.1 hypothetical protein CDN99_16505 [Roseateles aquatilis]
MNDAAKTFFTALAAVASAAVIAVWLADQSEAMRPPAASQHWATQTMPGPQADQASKPRG